MFNSGLRMGGVLRGNRFIGQAIRLSLGLIRTESEKTEDEILQEIRSIRSDPGEAVTRDFAVVG